MLSLLLALASRVVVVLGSVVVDRDAAPAGPFGLYAYGGGITGAQVFYSNGKLITTSENVRINWLLTLV